jgi:hypothetical protein
VEKKGTWKEDRWRGRRARKEVETGRWGRKVRKEGGR